MTATERKRRERQRRRDAGLVQLQLWALPQHHAAIKAFARTLADPPICDTPAGEAERAGGADPVAASVYPVAASTCTDPVAGKVPLAVSVDPVAGMEWHNPATGETLVRNADNTAWKVAPLAVTTGG